MLTSLKNSLILGLIIATVFACGKKKTDKKTIADNETVAVKLVDVSNANSTEPIKASGLISSLHEARLSFKTGGIIEKIFVKEGQNIAKGQLLATLNLTEINAQVSQAQENVSKIERDLKRVNALYRDSVATLEQVQNLTTALSVAKQSLQIAQYNQGYSKIYAPTNGVVVKKMMNEGELASSGSPVFFVNAAGANDWVVKVGIADKDWTRLKLGDKADISLDAFPDVKFFANVTTLSQGADQASGLYQAELKISTQGKKMATGLFAKALIYPSIKYQYASVPVDAIIEGNGDQAFVYVVENGKAKRVSLLIAYVNNQQAFVREGLTGVSQVVTDGSAYLVEGTKVKVMK
ncbi:efflux RND transporter periplasmic adaptor subunit [Flectobacillus roseus]|uniref:efflux RND transporter periplasmic adaptor subunit n=1 Tax=Flectobacillus roseus TaxID=502259 RepID=UPI0024B83C63|nr:efflux RND transporter periplasmic adaptor subunit [Flectobacillus roseus]MDI9870917.1 efflux RND transporter periplasmic adaptor subunit [Flectobacillus roseus]